MNEANKTIKEAVAANLKKYRLKNNLTQKNLGEKIGVKHSTVSSWEKGTNSISINELVKICKLFGITLDDMYSNVDKGIDPLQYDNIFPITTQKIPLIGEIACGEPIVANEELECYVGVGESIKADYCLRCKGDSMINARINDGDIVFIRQQPMVDNGEIAAVIIDDEVTLKRVYFKPERNMIILKPENTQYEDFVFIDEETEHIRILGKAVAFQSNVR